MVQTVIPTASTFPGFKKGLAARPSLRSDGHATAPPEKKELSPLEKAHEDGVKSLQTRAKASPFCHCTPASQSVLIWCS